MVSSHRNIESSSRAVIYVRVSTPQQAKDGISLAEQEALARHYCEWRGYEVVDVVADAGVTSSTPLARRPGGKRLLELIDSGAVGHVVTRDLTRTFRNASELLSWMQVWYERQVYYHGVKDNITNADRTAYSLMMMGVLAVLGEFQKNLIKEHASEASEYKRTRGEKYTGRVYGYKAKGKMLQASPREISIMDTMVRMKDGGATLAEIAHSFNERGERSAQGKDWHPESVRRVIARRRRELEQAA